MFKFYLVIIILLSVFFAKAQLDTNKIKIAETNLYNSGCAQIDSGKYKEAIVLFKAAIKLNKTFVEAYNKMALAKLKSLDYKGAIKDIQMASKIAPDNYEGQKIMGILYYDTKKYKEAKATLDSAGKLRNDDPELLYYQAKLMYEGKAYKKALDVCARALDIKPNYVNMMILKGEIRIAMKEYAYAVRELNEAFALIPALEPNYQAYKLRAKARFETRDYKNAITDWNVYMEAFPNEEEALISRGACKIEANDNTGAIVDFDEAIKLNPKNPVSYNYRGVAKGELRQFVEALKDFDYSIKLKYDYSGAFVNRAAVKFASKDKHGACDDLNKADSLGDNMAIQLIEAYCKH